MQLSCEGRCFSVRLILGLLAGAVLVGVLPAVALPDSPNRSVVRERVDGWSLANFGNCGEGSLL